MLFRSALKLFNTECIKLNKEFKELTKGVVEKPTQREALKNFFDENGLSLPNMQSTTITRALKKSKKLSETNRRLLEIRQAASKTSIAKYKSALERISADGRVHESLRYYGAGKTGRWSSSGVQLHNLVKSSLPKWTDYDFLVSLLMDENIKLINQLYGDTTEVISSCVRSIIKPKPGYKLMAGDYVGIEARVLAWLAQCKPLLRAFNNNEDSYIQLASEIFNKPEKLVSDEERFVGKSGILGLGYQMGAPKFISSVYEKADVIIPKLLGKKTVDVYRKKYKEIPALWKALNNASIEAVRRPGKNITATWNISFVKKGPHLHCLLPSGGHLVYAFASISVNKFDQPAIHYRSMVQGQWVSQSGFGGRWAENISQRVSRDIMAHGLLNVEKHGYPVIMSVHDESVSEVKTDFGSLEEYGQLLCDTEDWVKGCPITSECWQGPRYKK